MGDRQNTIILVDWEKAEEDPNKRQKVPGQLLFDLRTKCEFLKEKLELAGQNVNNLQKCNNSITKELEKTQATNKKSIEEKEVLIKDLELQIENLKIKLERNNNSINEFSDLLKEKESKIRDISTTSDQKISNINSELNAAYNKISALKGTVNSIKSDLTSKDIEIGEISLLNKELEDVKENLNLELIEKAKSLAQKKCELNELQKELDEKNNEIETQSKHLQSLELELEESKPLDRDTLSYSYDSRIKCPRCDAVGKYVKKVDDKNKVLSRIGNIPMYAKKYICKKCTYEWV